MKNFFLTLILVFAVISCTGISNLKKNQVPIVGTQWVLTDDVANKPTLVIEQNRISGNAGCNNYFSDANIDPTTRNFSAQNIGSTRKMCNDMSTETSYLEILPKVNRYVVTETTLELYKDNLLLLKFVKQ